MSMVNLVPCICSLFWSSWTNNAFEVQFSGVHLHNYHISQTLIVIACKPSAMQLRLVNVETNYAYCS